MTIFKKNNLNIGIGLGLMLPIILFYTLFGIVQMGLPLKIRTIALISICVNIGTINLFRQQRAGESVRGIVLATAALATLWIFNFYQEISTEWNG